MAFQGLPSWRIWWTPCVPELCQQTCDRETDTARVEIDLLELHRSQLLASDQEVSVEWGEDAADTQDENCQGVSMPRAPILSVGADEVSPRELRPRRPLLEASLQNTE